MNSTKRDKFLTEAMGGCWHEYDGNSAKPYHDDQTIWYCKCKQSVTTHNSWSRPKSFDDINAMFKQDIDFSTWEGFGKLWEWFQNQEWRCDINRDSNDMKVAFIVMSGNYFHEDLINPDRFADAVYKYLKERQ